MTSLALRRRMLGVDHGAARIGLAISDELALLAHPLETIPADRDAVGRIGKIIQERNIERVIVGLPRHMNGTMGEAAESARGFAQKLERLGLCEVITWDERLTTVAAQRALRETGRKTRTSRDYIDQIAAQLILQGYLDSVATGGEFGPTAPDDTRG